MTVKTIITMNHVHHHHQLDNDCSSISSSPLSSCPSSIALNNNMSDNINQFITDLINGFSLIQPTLESWFNLQEYKESDLMLPHLIAAETDVALYSIIHDTHTDWTSSEIHELLERTHTLICTTLPFPETCTSVILPQLRNAFPIQTYSQALLQWIKGTTSTLSTTENESILIDPLLVSFVVGRGTKPNDMILIGELSVNLIMSELSDPCAIGHCDSAMHHFRTIMKCACGWIPICCVMYMVGVFECLQTDALGSADLFIAVFPTIDLYESNHGDFGLFLAEFNKFEYSPISNFKQFLARLLAHYPIRTELNVFLNTPPIPTTLDELNALYAILNPSNLVHAKLMYNALMSGSAPMHVRLAFQMFDGSDATSLVPIALAMFKFGYENPLVLGFKYKLSGRLNDWRMIDRPSTAMDKIYKLIKHQHATSSPTSSPSINQYFNCLTHTDLEFGFMDPNELDEIELMTTGNDAQDQSNEDTYTAIHPLDKFDDEPDQLCHVDSMHTEASDDPVLDRDFIQLCFDEIDAVNGDLDLVNIDCLVDDLISRRQSSRFTDTPTYS